MSYRSPEPDLDGAWGKRPLRDGQPGQYYLHVPGMELASHWPMREEIIDRILQDRERLAAAEQLAAALAAISSFEGQAGADCPECRGLSPSGHEDGCVIGAALAAWEQAKQGGPA